MSDQVVLEEEVKKPELEFEDEWEVISENEAVGLEAEQDSEVVEDKPPERDIEQIIEERIAAHKPDDNSSELAGALKDLRNAIAPKDEQPKSRDWDKFEAEVADELSSDPKAALKKWREAYNQEVGQAMQYLQSQNNDAQKTISKLTAQNDPSLKVVFERWQDEVETTASKMPITQGMNVAQVYHEAAQKVKMMHFDEILDIKVQEAIQKVKPDASLPPNGAVKGGESPVVEGQKKRTKYVATPEQMRMINKSINPDIMRAKLIREGKLKRIS